MNKEDCRGVSLLAMTIFLILRTQRLRVNFFIDFSSYDSGLRVKNQIPSPSGLLVLNGQKRFSPLEELFEIN